MANVEYNGDRAFNQARRVATERLQASGRLVRNQAKVLLSVEGRFAVGGPRREKGTGKFLAARRVTVRSKPGESPRKQSGHLRTNVYAVMSDLEMKMRVGTGVKYGAILERGAPKIKLAARPWLIRAIRERQAQINRLFAQWSTR